MALYFHTLKRLHGMVLIEAHRQVQTLTGRTIGCDDGRWMELVLNFRILSPHCSFVSIILLPRGII